MSVGFKKMKKKKKKLTYGPNNTRCVVFVAATPLIAYFVDYIYIYTKH